MLFGGESAGTLLNDAWEFDSLLQTWTMIDGTVPMSPRFNCGIAADPVTGKMLLYGGEAANDAPEFTDAWTWDTDDGFLRVMTRGPEARTGDFVLVADPHRERIVLAGGDPSGAALWDYDGGLRQWRRPGSRSVGWSTAERGIDRRRGGRRGPRHVVVGIERCKPGTDPALHA